MTYDSNHVCNYITNEMIIEDSFIVCPFCDKKLISANEVYNNFNIFEIHMSVFHNMSNIAIKKMFDMLVEKKHVTNISGIDYKKFVDFHMSNISCPEANRFVEFINEKLSCIDFLKVNNDQNRYSVVIECPLTENELKQSESSLNWITSNIIKRYANSGWKPEYISSYYNKDNKSIITCLMLGYL